MAWPAILAGVAKGLGAAGAVKSMSQSGGGRGKVQGLAGLTSNIGSFAQREEMPRLSTPQAPAYNITSLRDEGRRVKPFSISDYWDAKKYQY